MWITALVIAAALITLSTVQLVRANPRSLVPIVGHAENEPNSALMTRLAGVAIGLIGGVALTPDHLKAWFALGVLLMVVPAVVIQTRHNAVVRKANR